MITIEALWAAQAALLSSLQAQEILEGIPVEFGFPVNLQPDHVWIDAASSGSMSNELTGTAQSDATFRLTVVVFTQRAASFAAVRDRLMTFTAAVDAALASETFAAAVPSWSVSGYNLDSGTDGRRRQLALELIVECRCW